MKRNISNEGSAITEREGIKRTIEARTINIKYKEFYCSVVIKQLDSLFLARYNDSIINEKSKSNF